MFSFCSLQGRVPHLHPIVLPLVPCPSWEGTPVTGSRSLLGGTPVPGRRYPSSGQGVPKDRVPPGQVRLGYPPARTRVSPWPGQDGVPPDPGQDGVPPRQVRMAPKPGQDGVPSLDRLRLNRLCRRRYTSCDFPQKDGLVKYGTRAEYP